MQEPEWSRHAMRALRAELGAAGVRACATCGCSTESMREPQQGRVGKFIAFSGMNGTPLDWMDIDRQPALMWHGTPETGRHRALMAATCRRCSAVTHFHRGAYNPTHPDLTTLTDEEQVEQDRH